MTDKDTRTGPSCTASLSLPQDQAMRLADALSELLWPPAAAVGLFENQDGTWRVEVTFSEPPDKNAFESFLKDHGAGAFKLSYRDVPDADWVAITQSELHPVRAGRFIVHGSHDRPTTRRSRCAIQIDAGQAFGTAHHGSTLGCMLALDDLAKCRRVSSVLDLGTGTGVLAIAAAKAWRAKVIASDIDPVATDIAKENFRLNGLESRITPVTAAGLRHRAIRARAPYDLIIANILERPLLAMAKEMAHTSRMGGIVVLSGITKEQAGRVTAAYVAAGLTRLRRYTSSDWATLTFCRRQCRH
jgi:ribosomal protein L11 methyltransferase